MSNIGRRQIRPLPKARVSSGWKPIAPCATSFRAASGSASRRKSGTSSPLWTAHDWASRIASDFSRLRYLMIGRPKLVLASGSPRRLALLNQAGIEPDSLQPAEVDELPIKGELPRALATRLARAKAETALASVKIDEELRGSYIIAADTVVAVGRRIMPKAEMLEDAAACLRLLSGRNHRVYTGVCLVTPKESFRQRLVETRVRFKRLSSEDIEAYLASGEWRGKAGGYAVQGLAGTFVLKMVGSYTNVVGLPLYETMSLLGGEGYPIHFGWLNAI